MVKVGVDVCVDVIVGEGVEVGVELGDGVCVGVDVDVGVVVELGLAVYVARTPTFDVVVMGCWARAWGVGRGLIKVCTIHAPIEVSISRNPPTNPNTTTFVFLFLISPSRISTLNAARRL
jgi:hypothetical protein